MRLCSRTNRSRRRRTAARNRHPQTGRLVATIENPSGLSPIDPVARKVLRQFDVKGKAPHMVRFGTDSGVAHVSNTGTGTLAAVNLQTGDAKTVPTGARPQGTAFPRDRKTLYVANSEAKTISILDAANLRVDGTIATGK